MITALQIHIWINDGTLADKLEDDYTPYFSYRSKGVPNALSPRRLISDYNWRSIGAEKIRTLDNGDVIIAANIGIVRFWRKL